MLQGRKKLREEDFISEKGFLEQVSATGAVSQAAPPADDHDPDPGAASEPDLHGSLNRFGGSRQEPDSDEQSKRV